MTASTGSSLLLAGASGLLLGIATPPADVPAGACLVLPGLMGWYAIATAGSRPLWHSYLLGCVHMAWFSWSLHHLLLPAYLAVVVLGGLYYLLATATVRVLPRRWWSLGFALAVAASFWLRAWLPEIHYPHGQPCHSLYQWPILLGAVTLGGEPLANALLAGLAASGVELWRSWRVGLPAWARAWRGIALSVFLAVGGTVGGHRLRASVELETAPESIDVAAVEPGFHPFEYLLAPAGTAKARYLELLEQRLLEPTRQLLRQAQPPALVLWPESALQERFGMDELVAGRATVLRGQAMMPKGYLVTGANALHPGEQYREPMTTVALLVSLPQGRVLGYQGKQFLVPGGEFLPLLGWLPASVADSLHKVFERALGTGPDCRADVSHAPLEAPDGTKFGALICYDNAFPGPAADQVSQGARFLAVLSNEAWYRGGAELEQLLAMTVVRAMENGTSIVRCTLDGCSALVDAAGQIIARLPQATAPQPAARILRVSVPLGSGRLPPMAWLRRGFGGGSAVLAIGTLALGLMRWVRLRAVRSARSDALGSGTPD